MTVAVEPKNNNIIIAIYNTGIKITNRGQWLRDKWNIRKGYLKIHVTVNIKRARKFFNWI